MSIENISFENDDYLDLCRSIYKKESYQEDYRLIYKVWVLYDLYIISKDKIKESIKEYLDIEISKVDDKCIKRLLETAFIFANLNTDKLVENSAFEEKEKLIEEIDNIKNNSYRIAISVFYYWKYLKEIGEEQKYIFNNNIIYRLFTRLWILTKSRDEKIDDLDIYSLDLQWKIEAVRKEAINKFSIKEELIKEKLLLKEDEILKISYNDIYFSDFQIWVMNELVIPKFVSQSWEKFKSVAVSAPTSAWKTFIIKNYLIYRILKSFLRNEKINIAFIVPSKALINELKSDFLELFEEYNISDNICNIHSHISWDDFLGNHLRESNLFILTQERLNYFYNDIKFKDNWKSFKFDITVVDEAHKVWYWYRWTLLSYIIWKIKKDNNSIQIILLAPLLSKLHKFKDEFWLELLEEKYSNFWLVAKNQIYVEIKNDWPKQRKYTNFYLNISYKKDLLFRIDKNFWDRQPWYLAELAKAFSFQEQAILFRFNRASVEKQAEKLLNNNSLLDDENYISIYLEDILPHDFPLSKYLKNGIAYHNWALPVSIKSKIEDLFKDWNLKYLCANSTILEWVNLPAKNIFIWLDWKKEEISSLDFKNLVWRAWRLNQHLSWNVFYIDFDGYDEKIIDEENPTWELINNITNILWNWAKFDRFLDYIKPWSLEYKTFITWEEKEERKEFEYVTWFLVSNIIDESKINFSNRYNENLQLLDKDFFNSRLEDYKIWKSKDFIDKIWSFIYGDKEYKAEKISLLREYIYSLCNNDLKINNKSELDRNFLNVVKKNIFVDPRKQLDFYELVIFWKQKFILENIEYFSNINNLINDDKENKKLKLKSLIKEVNSNFLFLVHEFEDFDYLDLISWLMNQWISSVSLKQILSWRESYFKTLKRISDELQFTYLNWVSIFFELANLWYKKYLSYDFLDDDNKNFDINFLYYLELWSYYPNVVYLISKWISRESAIFLKDKWIIKPYSESWNSKEYFKNEKDRILLTLRENNKIMIAEELDKFI